MFTLVGRSARLRFLAAFFAAAIVVACSPRAPTPPSAEFLLATPDSTFWVRSGATGIRIRAVPMTIARYDSAFHEVYVADLDRSFNDAVLTGERVYVRDLLSDDSTLVYDDTTINSLADRHARAHPDAIPLNPDDDTPDNPPISADGETDILDVRGPYILLEHRSSFEHFGNAQSDTVQAAIDLRTARAATRAAMTHDSAGMERDVVRSLPQTWNRGAYTLLARGDSAGGSVSLTLRDRARHVWPLLTVSERPRIYWLDSPRMDARTRVALSRAFNEAAAYGETVKYVTFTPLPPRVAHRSHRAHHTRARHPSPRHA